MSNKIKDVNIKNCTYYFFNDILDIENFSPNNIKIDEKYIYFIGYMTIKEFVKLYSVKRLYLIFRNVNGYFE